MNGIRFFRVIWQRADGKFEETTEAAHSMRYLKDQIKKGTVAYFDGGNARWSVVKVQEVETPMIEVEWLLNVFTTGGTKKDRVAHAKQAAYVLRLVEKCAARVALETGEIIER